jgi:hypothetical protein
LFYLIFGYLFALSQQVSYRLPLAIDRPIDMFYSKLFRLTTHLSPFTMANRPRRSRLTQTFAVPNEDDIYDDASIAPLDETGTAEDTDNNSLIDINKTIAALLNDADS